MRRSIKVFSLALFTILLFSIPSYPKGKMRIAILDLKGNNVSNIIASTVTDLITADIVNTDLFDVVEMEQIDKILKEIGIQQSGCSNQSCAMQVGKRLSAKKILLGEVSKIGNSIIITIRFVDVEKGLIEHASKEKAMSEDFLDIAASKLTQKLVERIEGKEKGFIASLWDGMFSESGENGKEKEIEEEKEKEQDKEERVELVNKDETDYYMRSIVPGWGQFYIEKTTKGYVYMSSFIISSIFTIYGIVNFEKKRNDYMDLTHGTLQSEFDKKNDAKEKARKIALSGIGLTTMVYVANWIDILFFNNPLFKKNIIGHSFFDEGNICFNMDTDTGDLFLRDSRFVMSFELKF